MKPLLNPAKPLLHKEKNSSGMAKGKDNTEKGSVSNTTKLISKEMDISMNEKGNNNNTTSSRSPEKPTNSDTMAGKIGEDDQSRGEHVQSRGEDDQSRGEHVQSRGEDDQSSVKDTHRHVAPCFFTLNLQPSNKFSIY